MSKDKQWIAVELKEYITLLNRDLELDKLEALGVDNWNRPDIPELDEEYKPYKLEDFKEHVHLIHE